MKIVCGKAIAILEICGDSLFHNMYVESLRDIPYGNRNLQKFMYSLPTILPCSGRYSGQRVHKFLQISITIRYISPRFNYSPRALYVGNLRIFCWCLHQGVYIIRWDISEVFVFQWWVEPMFKIPSYRCHYCSSATSGRVGSIPTVGNPIFFHRIYQFLAFYCFLPNISKWLKVLTYFRKVIKRELLPKTNI
jgi:hypothetical protein